MEKGDFIEINYTGKTKDGFVFDTTDKSLATKSGMDPNKTYGPITICLGEGQLLPGLDKKLVGKDAGKHAIELTCEEAFGKKNPKLIQLISTQKFKKAGMNPQAGMQVNIDGKIAVVKRTGGGRTLVDFNHPLSGVDVSYDIEIIKKVDDVKEKADSYVTNTYGNIKHELDKDNKLTLHVKSDIPEEIQKVFKENFNRVIPEVKDIAFAVQKEDAKEAKKE